MKAKEAHSFSGVSICRIQFILLLTLKECGPFTYFDQYVSITIAYMPNADLKQNWEGGTEISYMPVHACLASPNINITHKNGRFLFFEFIYKFSEFIHVVTGSLYLLTNIVAFPPPFHPMITTSPCSVSLSSAFLDSPYKWYNDILHWHIIITESP